MPEQQPLDDFIVRCAGNRDKVGFTFVDGREFLGWIADVTEDRMLVMWAPPQLTTHDCPGHDQRSPRLRCRSAGRR